MFFKILPFLLDALQFLSQIGCLASSINVVSMEYHCVFLAQGQVSITFQSHLVECMHCPLKSAFHYRLGF